MDLTDKKYFVVPTDMINSLDFNSLEDMPNFVRKSLDGTMCIVQYTGSLELLGFFLNHEEALTLMATPEWSAPTYPIE